MNFNKIDALKADLSRAINERERAICVSIDKAFWVTPSVKHLEERHAVEERSMSSNLIRVYAELVRVLETDQDKSLEGMSEGIAKELTEQVWEDRYGGITRTQCYLAILKGLEKFRGLLSGREK